MATLDDIVGNIRNGVTAVGRFVQAYTAPGQTLSSATSPAATLVSGIGTTAVQLLPSSVTRRAVLFANPTPGGPNMWVSPSNVTATINGGLLVQAGSSIILGPTIACNSSFTVVAASSGSNKFLAWEFF